MKHLPVIFAVFLTLGFNHETEFLSTEKRVEVYTDTCFEIQDLYCSIEMKQVDDGYWKDAYQERSISIEKTWKLK